MTIQEIKDQYAQMCFCEPWDEFIQGLSAAEMEHHMNDIARRYARECAKASLEKASDRLTKVEFDKGLAFTGQDIITNPENIVL